MLKVWGGSAMVRLTRAQQQERTRAAVLAAARQEFTEHGYVDAKVDRIAERAELTRGAVYSNFPSKRALYLAVLFDLVGHAASSLSSRAGSRRRARRVEWRKCGVTRILGCRTNSSDEPERRPRAGPRGHADALAGDRSPVRGARSRRPSEAPVRGGAFGCWRSATPHPDRVVNGRR
jgi:AcrR family transcriptional regulator